MSTRIKPQILTESPILHQLLMEASIKNISQSAMAGFLNTSQSRVSEWSRGRVEPGVMTVEALANCLGYRLTLEAIEEKRLHPQFKTERDTFYEW